MIDIARMVQLIEIITCWANNSLQLEHMCNLDFCNWNTHGHVRINPICGPIMLKYMVVGCEPYIKFLLACLFRG